MDDKLDFDFSRAQSLLKAINKCKSSLDNLGNRLDKEVIKAGSWWLGGSYIAYKETFSDANRGKEAVVKIAENTASTRIFLIKAATMKKDWEQSGKQNFI